MPINNMFSTGFNTGFGSGFSIGGNNIQSITKQQKYPGLNAEQVKRLEASVNGLTGTAKTQQLQKNYRAMIQIINDQNINDNRTAVNNERFKNSLNKKDARECRFDQSACRQSDLVDLVKSVKGLKASTDENTVMTKLMKEMSIRGVEMDSLNNYLDKGDETFLYEMGLAQQPQQSNALSIKGTVADNEGGEWNDNLFGRFETEQYDKNASLGENALTFGKNLLKSGVNVLSDVGNMIVNPLDTVNALGKTVVGGTANLLGVDEDMAQWGDRFNSANDTADQVGQFFKERYYGDEGEGFDVNNLLNTLFTDPVGVVSDVATLVSGGAGAVKAGATGAAKATARAGLKGATRTLERASNTAGKIAKAGLEYDPYSVAMKLEMKPISATIDYAKKLPGASKVMKEKLNEALDKAVGLDENTKRNIQNNPFSKEVWQKAKTWIDANGLPEKSTEVSKQLITDVADRVQETMKKQMAELGETGPMYQPLKEAGFSVDLTDLKAGLDNMLNEYGIKIEDGKLDFSKTAIDGSEANNIKKIYDRVQSTDAPMSMTEYLERFRKTISDMVDFNTNNRDAIGKKLGDTPGDKVLKGIRESANKLAHEQVPALKDLDAVFKKQTDLIKEVTDGIVYKDKTKMGAVRDNINQIIKNLDEPNRRVLKNRLEKVLPGIEEEVKAINMLPKLIDRYYKPSKMQQTLTSSAGAAVGGTIGGIPGGILGAGAGYILSNRIDKLKSNKWDKVISTTSEEGASKMSDIQNRIANNEKISQAQKAFLKEISQKLKEGKQVKEGEVMRIISDIMSAEEGKELAVLDKAISELETLGAKDEVKEWKKFREDMIGKMDEEAEMNRYAEEFEAEKQNIINESADQRLPEFKRRIYQLGQEERRIGSVAGKKIGKNFEGKDYHRQQQTEWLRKKEAVIKEIQDYYNVDQFEASEIYDRIERQASADDLSFSKSQASSKTAKYQVADDMDKAYEEAVRAGNEAKAKEILKQYAESKGYKGTEDYKGRGAWAAPSSTVDKADFRNLEKLGEALEDSGESSLYAVANGYSAMPEDMLERGNTWRYFRTNTEREAYYPIREAMDEIQRQMEEYGEVRDMPKVTVYRAVPDYSKSIKKLQSDIDKFIIGEDGKPHINGSLSQLSKDALESYDYYADMYKKYGGTTPEENLYERLTNDRDYKDSLSVKEGMLESGGEWVTPSKQYAKDHGNNRFDGEYKIIKDEIPADQLWWDGNAIEEWGFDDGNEYAVKKGTKNSRKNLEIEYDDKGNLIPLSKRFNEKKADPRYQKYGVAGQGEKGISATEGLNIRNFKNGKTVQELANQYGIDTKIVDSISTPEGQRAYGMYGDRLITLSKDLKESTVPHELLHGVFDIVDNTRKTSILEGIQKKLNIDNVQAEEWLADNFSEYYRTGKFGTKGLAKGLVEKVKQFFYEVKSYIDGTYKNEKQIRQLFDDIIDGKIEGEYGVYSDPKFQSVWHGSPADFERFDSTHMGEGEGAQAHGWGHYVAKEEGTGRHYAEMARRQNGKTSLYKGKTWNEWMASGDPDRTAILSLWEEKGNKSLADFKKWWLDDYKEGRDYYKMRIEAAQENLRDEAKYFGNRDAAKYEKEIENLQVRLNTLEKQKEVLKKMKESDFEDRYAESNLYEVEIPDPIKKDTPTGSNYFEEDSFVENNAVDKIVKAVKDSGLEVGEREGNWKGIDKMIESYMTEKGIQAKNMYHILKVVLGSDKAASKFLESLGYDGIHYFGGRDGEAYVIFNDDALEITKHHKY